MKNLFILFSVALIGLLACKKDTPLTAFDKATYADILQYEPMFSPQDIYVKYPEPDGLKPGAIIFYKTKDGTYGKLKIVSTGEGADPKLTIDIVNYKSDGTVLNKHSNVVIGESVGYDLETGLTYNGQNNSSDFFWGSPDAINYRIIPIGGSEFYVFLKP
jgi:hypothetical protein